MLGIGQVVMKLLSIVQKSKIKLTFYQILKSQVKFINITVIVPELARVPFGIIDKLISKSIDRAKITLKQIDAIASTAGPGLSRLLVGVVAGIAHYLKPFIAINHFEVMLSIKLEEISTLTIVLAAHRIHNNKKFTTIINELGQLLMMLWRGF